MEAQEFDRLTSVHTTAASRRGVVAGFGRGLVAALSLALVGSASLAEADAKGKHKKHKKHKKHHQSGTGSPTDPGTPAGPTSPPSLPTGPGSCSAAILSSEWTKGRLAQTFLPPQGGQLTTATVYLLNNPDFSLGFEIRTVDAWGAPTNNVLASEIVGGIQKTKFTDPPQAVTVTFANPATLTLGQPYALTVRGPGNVLYFVGAVPGNGCQDGRIYRDELNIGDFVALADNVDMAYSLTVV